MSAVLHALNTTWHLHTSDHWSSS